MKEKAEHTKINCKICSESSEVLFHAKVLNKYNVLYYKCSNCGFIETENPYWLEEAYKSPIASLDIGLVSRNIELSGFLENVLILYFNADGKFVDYGGGYGMLVRLMRDLGFNYYRQDYFCENIFAKGFDVTDIKNKKDFEALSAFEVFEHLTDPLKEVEKMFQYSESIIFSTILQPEHLINSHDDWWYFVPETGQHISFFTKKSLEILASKNNCKLYSNNNNLHLLTKDRNIQNIFEPIEKPGILLRITKKILNVLQPNKYQKRKSLLNDDFESLRKKS